MSDPRSYRNHEGHSSRYEENRTYHGSNRRSRSRSRSPENSVSSNMSRSRCRSRSPTMDRSPRNAPLTNRENSRSNAMTGPSSSYGQPSNPMNTSHPASIPVPIIMNPNDRPTDPRLRNQASNATQPPTIRPPIPHPTLKMSLEEKYKFYKGESERLRDDRNKAIHKCTNYHMPRLVELESKLSTETHNNGKWILENQYLKKELLNKDSQILTLRNELANERSQKAKDVSELTKRVDELRCDNEALRFERVERINETEKLNVKITELNALLNDPQNSDKKYASTFKKTAETIIQNLSDLRNTFDSTVMNNAEVITLVTKTLETLSSLQYPSSSMHYANNADMRSQILNSLALSEFESPHKSPDEDLPAPNEVSLPDAKPTLESGEALDNASVSISDNMESSSINKPVIRPKPEPGLHLKPQPPTPSDQISELLADDVKDTKAIKNSVRVQASLKPAISEVPGKSITPKVKPAPNSSLKPVKTESDVCPVLITLDSSDDEKCDDYDKDDSTVHERSNASIDTDKKEVDYWLDTFSTLVTSQNECYHSLFSMAFQMLALAHTLPTNNEQCLADTFSKQISQLFDIHLSIHSELKDIKAMKMSMEMAKHSKVDSFQLKSQLRCFRKEALHKPQ